MVSLSIRGFFAYPRSCHAGHEGGYAKNGLDHGVGHFRPLSITRQRHLLVYHRTAMSHASLCQVF
jgi:hypothetical protein